MPNVVCLKDKSTGYRVQGSALVELDEMIAKHLGVEVDPELWVDGWMDRVGLSLATGMSWDQMRKIYANSSTQLAIVEYLAERYDNDSYYVVR